MWTAWDFVTRKMVPDSMLLEKPIDSKHICLFYTGHVPVFLDMQVSNLLGEPNTEPEYFEVSHSFSFFPMAFLHMAVYFPT